MLNSRFLVIILFFFLNNLSIAQNSQHQVNNESYTEYKKSEKKINDLYKKNLLLRKSDTAFVRNLKVAQRLWIKFRDAEIDAKFSEGAHNYGSMYPMLVNNFMQTQTERRIEELEMNYLENNENGNFLDKEEVVIKKTGLNKTKNNTENKPKSGKPYNETRYVTNKKSTTFDSIANLAQGENELGYMVNIKGTALGHNSNNLHSIGYLSNKDLKNLLVIEKLINDSITRFNGNVELYINIDENGNFFSLSSITVTPTNKEAKTVKIFIIESVLPKLKFSVGLYKRKAKLKFIVKSKN